MLGVTQLIGFGAFNDGAPLVSATKVYRGSQVDTTDQTTYTFSPITVSSSDNYIAIGLLFLAGSARGISSASITGDSSGIQSVAASITGGTLTAYSGLCQGALSGDTSVTFSVTLSGGATCAAIAAWSGIKADAVPTVASDTSHSYTSTTDITSQGVAFAMAINSNTSSPTISVTGTGWSKEEDITMEGGIKGVAVSGAGPVTATLTVSFSSATDPGRMIVHYYTE